MLYSLGNTPIKSLNEVHSMTLRPPMTFENLNYTGNSSLFVSHPDGSFQEGESEAPKKTLPDEISASQGQFQQSASQASSPSISRKPFPRKDLTPEDEHGHSLNKNLDEFQDLKHTVPGTNTEQVDKTNSTNIEERDSKNITTMHSISVWDSSATQASNSFAQLSLNKNSPFTTPSENQRNSLEVSSRRPSSHSERSLEFQHLSFLDDTKAQFDSDINIDDYKASMRKSRGSPWRNFRNNAPALLFSHPTNTHVRQNFAESNGVASTEKMEDLSKQLTNCKIQLKLYEKFLQDLIDNQSINFTGVTSLHLSLDRNPEINAISKSPTRLEAGDALPEKELMEMANLLEDLYASLEEYQIKWRDADSRLSGLDLAISQFVKESIHILEEFGVSTASLIESGVEKGPEIHLSHILQLLRDLKPLKLFSNSGPAKPSTISSRSSLCMEENPNFSPHVISSQRQNQNHSEYASSTPQKSDSKTLTEGSINSKLQEYQAMIDRLQGEVNELKAQGRFGSASDISDNTYYSPRSRDREKMLLIQKDYEILQEAHHDLIDEHHSYKSSLERTIASLRNQLETLQRDKHALRSELVCMKNIQRDLDVSVEKQRILTAEKIKLSYQVESLTQDKVSLQKNLENLTSKLATAPVNDASSIEVSRQKASDASDALDEFFELSIEEFEKLLKSFNRIADDHSLEEPQKKIGFLIPLKGARLIDQPRKVLLSMKDAHRSIFRFFSRAVDVIVNDHIHLLLKDGEQKENYEARVTKLENIVKTLEARNKQLSERPEYMPSPRLKLRIEELTARWKAEREARILENRQAEKRLHELAEEAKINT